jgi:hypothetical protein
MLITQLCLFATSVSTRSWPAKEVLGGGHLVDDGGHRRRVGREQHEVELGLQQLGRDGVEGGRVAVDADAHLRRERHRVQRQVHRVDVGLGGVGQVHDADAAHAEVAGVRDHALVLEVVAGAHVECGTDAVRADAHVAAGRAEQRDLRLLHRGNAGFRTRAAGEADEARHAEIEQRRHVLRGAGAHAAIVQRDQLEARAGRLRGRGKGGRDAVTHVPSVARLAAGERGRLTEADDVSRGREAGPAGHAAGQRGCRPTQQDTSSFHLFP